MTAEGHHRHPGTAAVLSLVIPGVGQIYNGDFLRGIFWLIVTPGFWIFSGGPFRMAVSPDRVLHRVSESKRQERGIRL